MAWRAPWPGISPIRALRPPDPRKGASLLHRNQTMTQGHAKVVSRCQLCDSPELQPVCFVGYLPPVNTMLPIGQSPREEPAFPAQVLCCRRCQLVQIGLVVRQDIIFPPEYAYRSGTTRILRDNFAEMYRECSSL